MSFSVSPLLLSLSLSLSLHSLSPSSCCSSIAHSNALHCLLQFPMGGPDGPMPMGPGDMPPVMNGKGLLLLVAHGGGGGGGGVLVTHAIFSPHGMYLSCSNACTRWPKCLAGEQFSKCLHSLPQILCCLCYFVEANAFIIKCYFICSPHSRLGPTSFLLLSKPIIQTKDWNLKRNCELWKGENCPQRLNMGSICCTKLARCSNKSSMGWEVTSCCCAE